MVTNQQLAAFFSALGNERRLKIIENIEKGISNPGQLSKKMDTARSTIEKHIRVLVEGGVLEKDPGLNPEGQLRVYYKVRENVRKLLEMVRRQEIY
ncbi:MAG: helix-turn-helix domain-containing protein [Candidatus Heimdallarchaeota archaeon]|nr:helix-turn-helix domain-containing protein [Candidatus Heimdallarchaeota archaeon]